MDRKTLLQCTAVLLGFSLLCFIMSGYFNLGKGKPIKEILPAEGGMVGPVEVMKKNTVYLIKVSQNVKNSTWSSVTGELLDEKKEYLFGFGKEMWAESGRDSEGYWSEKVNSYKMKVTIPKKGLYYLRFNTEKSPGVDQNITVNVKQKAGSSLPFFWAAVISLILGVVAYQRMSSMNE